MVMRIIPERPPPTGDKVVIAIRGLVNALGGNVPSSGSVPVPA